MRNALTLLRNMGQYFRIVNVDKKQFIDIGKLGENCKFSGIGQGLQAIALGRLITSLGEITKLWTTVFGHPEKDEFYVGAWAGDRIVIAGDYDYADVNNIPTSLPDIPDLNLYDKVDIDADYENVTLKVITWLANDVETADMLAENAKYSMDLLRDLADLVFIHKHRQMKKSIENVIGKDWAKLLNKNRK